MLTKPWMQVHPAEAVQTSHRNDVKCSQPSCMLNAMLSMFLQLYAEGNAGTFLGRFYIVLRFAK